MNTLETFKSPELIAAESLTYLRTAVDGVRNRMLETRTACYYLRNAPTEAVIQTETYVIHASGRVTVCGIALTAEQANEALRELAGALRDGDAKWINEDVLA